MPKLIKLLNHELTEQQKNELKTKYGIQSIITPPPELQSRWSNIPPEFNEEELQEYLTAIKDWLFYNTNQYDLVLIQGESGATYNIVSYLKHAYRIPIYATTKREVVEEVQNGKTVKKSVFKHIRFREY